MLFQTPLVPARLLRRYKRFLADAVLEDGREITAHCANPGSMAGLAEAGTRIWLEPNDDPRKKLKFSWRLVDHGNGHFTGVDTGIPNQLIKAALSKKSLPGLTGYDEMRSEVRYGKDSRIDFWLGTSGGPDTFVEVKSVTLCREPGLAEFPDSITARGAKHLAALAEIAREGHRAVMLYVVQRTDCHRARLASDIDPAYAEAAREARAQGVVSMALACRLSPTGVKLGAALPIEAP